MSIIDFKELSASNVKGEELQNLSRKLGQKLKLEPSWSGRGPDGGKDLIFVEEVRGILTAKRVKWLVSCKDYAVSNKSVQESDVGSVLEKVKQHKADGFLLVTTTTVSSGLKSMLDSLDKRNGGDIEVSIWDAAELTTTILKEEMKEIFQQFFPESYKKLVGSFDDALEHIENQLPKYVFDQFMKSAAPYIEGKLNFSGEDIAFGDIETAKTIDKISEALYVTNDSLLATIHASSLDEDIFISFVSRLDSCDDQKCADFLEELIRNSNNPGTVLNSLQYLSENHDIGNQLRLELATYVEEGGLNVLFYLELTGWISDELCVNAGNYEYWAALDELSTGTTFDFLNFESLSFEVERGKSVTFSGDFSVDVTLRFGSSSDAELIEMSFPGKFEGIFDFRAGEYKIVSTSIDTSKFHK